MVGTDMREQEAGGGGGGGYILHYTGTTTIRAQELCESRSGRPGLPSLINLRFLWT